MRSIQRKSELAWMRAAAMGTAAWIAFMIATGVAGAQVTPPPYQPPGDVDHSETGTRREDTFGTVPQKVVKEQMEKRNKLRQAQLVADTNKLLILATELKADVDKSDKDTLSVTVVRKSEEIEKLAKSVKDKMKNPY